MSRATVKPKPMTAKDKTDWKQGKVRVFDPKRGTELMPDGTEKSGVVKTMSALSKKETDILLAAIEDAEAKGLKWQDVAQAALTAAGSDVCVSSLLLVKTATMS
jgi:hypothetical protein